MNTNNPLSPILYVDDEKDNLTVFYSTFRRVFDIHLASSGFEGIEIMRNHEIHLIITDQRMPEMTGIQFLEKIIPGYPDCIRMILTGYSDIEAIIQAINTGRVYRYITKPWDKEELKITIDNGLETYRLKQQNRILLEELKDANKTLEQKVIDRTRKIEAQNREIMDAQDKLIIQSKMAALGTLTAGIAHEIKNPLNFINNFAGLNAELIDQLQQEVKQELINTSTGKMEGIIEILTTLKQTAKKIHEHGNRLDSIVRRMMQHSPTASRELQLTDINTLLEEAINLTYHSMRAQNNNFETKVETSLDKSLDKINVIPQEICRVFFNIISNACYEVHQKKLEGITGFSPTLFVSTQKSGDQMIISIRDNGNGIPESIRDRLFTPFLTTKPAGQGVGLGLSIAYDIIVLQHKGRISFETEEGIYTEFNILLPYSQT